MTNTELFTYRLTREETLLIVKLLRADTIMGLEEDDPTVEGLTDQQKMVGFLYADRSLRARQIARLDADGQLQIVESLLRAIATCAYPTHTISLHHYPQLDTVLPLWSHMREDEVVLHSMPEPGIHQFDQFSTSEDLIDFLIEQADCAELAAPQGQEITLTRDQIEQIRDARNNPDQIRDLATQFELAEDAIDGLVNVFGSEYKVSVFHTLATLGENQAQGWAYTIAHTENQAWLMVEEQENYFLLSPCSTALLRNTLISSLRQAPVTN